MLSRRELISALLGSQVAMLAGCSRQSLPAEGRLLAPHFSVGHRIRDGFRPKSGVKPEEVDVVIVGGGIAGLSAGWRLEQSGLTDYRILELDAEVGGTAQSGQHGEFAYPWGAHYLPVPMAENRALIQLLRDMNVLERVSEDGTPAVREEHLCRDPSERVFHDGRWHEGLYPQAGASDDDLKQLKEFRQEVDRWVERRDSKGRRMFAIPIATASDDEQVMSLDQQSMAQWMNERGWTSPRLRWLVDYSCRDDYGLSATETSAWAGLFYFASRVRNPGDSSQPIITWPEGNGRIVKHLSKKCQDRLRKGHAVTQITRSTTHNAVDLTAFDNINQETVALRAKRVIFAAPQFLAPHLISGFASDRGDRKNYSYGCWLVANVHLSERPAETGFPMCWDNVIQGSKSLGYVTSTHQLGIDHGPTVLTWYYPFCDVDPRVTRQQLLSLDWSHWADLVMSDLEIPHPDIRSKVTRLDVMRWGHAMIQPRVGFVSSPDRMAAAQPLGPIHFAGTDLSGVALMEEAFFHGVRASEEVLHAVGAGAERIVS